MANKKSPGGGWANDFHGLIEMMRRENESGLTLYIGKGISDRLEDFLEDWMYIHGNHIQWIEVEEANLAYRSMDGILYDKTGKELLFCPYGKTGRLIIPDGVEEIGRAAMRQLDLEYLRIPGSVEDIRSEDGNGAFDCSTIKKLELGDGLEEISPNAFAWAKIGKVKLPGSVRRISYRAFYESGLESVELNEGLEAVGDEAFEECRLKKVRIPASVKAVGAYAFGRGLESVKIEGTKPLKNIFDSILSHNIAQPATVEIGGQRFAFPSRPDGFESMVWIGNPEVKEFLKKWDSGDLDMDFARDAFQHAHGAALMQDTALLELSIEPGNGKAQGYVKTKSEEMAKRYIETGDEGSLVRLIKSGAAGIGALRLIIGGDASPAAKAYAMEEMQMRKMDTLKL